MIRKKNPAVEVSHAAWRHVHKFCSEFGMSPVSRTRLAIEKKVDPMAELKAILEADDPDEAPGQFM
jgi:P27 family predicted phage terminase small subunit